MIKFDIKQPQYAFYLNNNQIIVCLNLDMVILLFIKKIIKHSHIVINVYLNIKEYQMHFVEKKKTSHHNELL
ncbi:Hypothetical protein EHI5A_028120 [Entamoeba histolytica KU27]|uniref:Uncharacterized protein n=1 Tax=Entamoeba histolytica KU27 TaxID=885311 RepID=M2Q919_ENTHI|nr:Hypothetical protein EHI5A_028120 [Entamoeba histolytica KU27]